MEKTPARRLFFGRNVLCKAIDDTQVLDIKNGAVLVEGDAIVEVGSVDDLIDRYPDIEVLGSDDYVIIPGLVNGHHHVGLTPVQLGTRDLPLEQWLVAQIGSRHVDPYLDTLVSGYELIASGVTAVQHLDRMLPAPVSSWPDRSRKVIQAYGDLGMRVSYALCVRDQNRLVYGDDDAFIKSLPQPLQDEVRTFIARSPFPLEDFESDYLLPVMDEHRTALLDGMLRVWLAPINLERASDRLLTLTKSLASKYSIGIHLHLSETLYQRKFSELRFGKSSVKHLDEIGFLGPEVTLGHSVWVDEDDLDIIRLRRCAICHNASSNLRLRSGIAPLREFLCREIPVSMGIDEAGLNDDRDMLQEMRLVKHLHATPGLFISPIKPAEIFRMATEGGAYATGFGEQIGSVEPGKKADLVFIDWKRLSTPHLDERITTVEALIYRARTEDVKMVVINGEIVYQNGTYSRSSPAETFASIAEELQSPLTPTDAERRKMSDALFPFIRDYYKDWELPTSPPFYALNGR